MFGYSYLQMFTLWVPFGANIAPASGYWDVRLRVGKPSLFTIIGQLWRGYT
jgi:hypothetical protein